jgi:type III secretion protein L
MDKSASETATPPLSPGIKIIRAGELNAWRDAYSLLAEAKTIYEAERARGYAEGLEAAKRDASRIVVEASNQVDRYLAAAERDVAQLAMDIVRRVINEFDDAELVARTARNALADFREAKTVHLRVHPDAAVHIEVMINAYKAEHNEGQRFVIETDESLGTKACILSTEFTVVEATIETQLAAISDALERAAQDRMT